MKFLQNGKKDPCKKLLKEIITKTHKSSEKQKKKYINYAAKIRKLLLEVRVKLMQETESYTTSQDHKQEFPNKILCRLIIPSKSSIRKISKVILYKINEKILASTTKNQ